MKNNIVFIFSLKIQKPLPGAYYGLKPCFERLRIDQGGNKKGTIRVFYNIKIIL